MAKNFEGIKNQRYGVEIECTGLTRSSAAKAVAKVLGGSPEHYGGSYDRYDVKDSKTEHGRSCPTQVYDVQRRTALRLQSCILWSL